MPYPSPTSCTRRRRPTTGSTRITDGTDPDWASWYADWLIEHSELPTPLDVEPVRSELVYLLVLLDKEYTQRQVTERWEHYYADRIAEHFTTS